MSSGAQKLRDKLRSSQKTKDPSEKFDVRVSVNEHVAAVLKKLKEKEVNSLTFNAPIATKSTAFLVC